MNEVKIVHKNGRYKVSVTADLEMITNDFSKVQEEFEVLMAFEFANAVRKAFSKVNECTD